MKSFGDTLREARERKGVTPSDAAAATRIKVQIIEDLEQNRLRRTHAPIYAKGFIRMYGEYLGLDTASLLSAYENQRHTPTETPVPHRTQPVQSLQTEAPKTKALREHKIAIAWSRLRKTVLDTGHDVAQRIRRIPVAAWRKQIVDRIQSMVAPPAKAIRNRPPEDDIEPATAAARLPWHERLHHAIRGPYRLHAAVFVITILLLILIIILGASIRRHLSMVDDPGVTPPAAGDKVTDHEFMELTHEPPPPYYR